jgi:hypothetical protein
MPTPHPRPIKPESLGAELGHQRFEVLQVIPLNERVENHCCR